MVYGYYRDSLSGEKLKRVYEVAPPRVRRYLEAEIDHVLGVVDRGGNVLEMGCGYGRILPRLTAKAGMVVGIDASLKSLLLGRRELGYLHGCYLLCMDAAQTAFADRAFDCVVCIQNGISAFHVNRQDLIREAVRVTKGGGVVLFSTYAAGFWASRLEWFELQAAENLLGDLDYEKTGDGVIVCKDGFTASTVSADDFRAVTRGLDADIDLVEVDGSSLFCEIRVS